MVWEAGPRMIDHSWLDACSTPCHAIVDVFGVWWGRGAPYKLNWLRFALVASVINALRSGSPTGSSRQSVAQKTQ